ncbi:MAG: response regulator [Gemmatimonadetes bacterium]|nr:response regulator [Gemmatimonadota bacterium]
MIADGGLPDIPLVYVNAEFERMTGYSLDEVVGRNCRILQGPDTDPADVARMRSAIADQTPIDLTLRNYRKDGSAFWNHLRILPVRQPDRELPYYVGYARVLDPPISGPSASEPALRIPSGENRGMQPESFFGIADFDGLVTEVSGGQGGDAGDSDRKWMGIPLWDLPWWKGAAEIGTLLEDTVRRARLGQSTHRDLEMVSDSGPSRWAELRVEPRVDDQGNPRDLLVSMLDVTDRVEAERFRHQLKEVVENSPDGIVCLDANRRATFTNRAALELFGVDAQDALTGQPFQDLIESADAAFDLGVLAEIEEGGAWEGLGAATGPAGRRTPVSIAILRHRPDSARDDLSLILRDRTDVERRHRLLLAELRTARILDNTSSLDEAIPEVVHGLADTLGAFAVEYLIPGPDSGWQPFFSTGEGPQTAAPSPQSTARSSDLADRAWARLKPVWDLPSNADGNAAQPHMKGSRDTRSVALPIPSESGPLGTIVLHFSGNHTEETAWSEGLSNVARSIRDFHRWEQTETQLRAARVAADAASEAKSRFLGRMSHELRTPMAAILGYAELLLTRVDPESRSMLEVILRNGNHMVDMLNDILDLTRVEQGHIDLTDERFSPVAMAYDLASLMRVRAEANSLRFKTHYEGVLPREIETDPTRVRQILINLIGNAIRFTDEGEVGLTLRGNADGPNPTLVFDVTDTGVGIAPEHLETIFKPFDQGDPSTDHRHEGTGLGLAISKQLAEALGAELTATSKVGVGSTFSLSLPLAPGIATSVLTDEDVERLTSLADPVTHVPSVELEGRYLVVDDHKDMRRLVAHYLTHAGAIVQEAADGGEAVRLVEAAIQADMEPFRAVVMDMQMPVMDGYQATQIIRARSPMTPVIALSAGAMKGDREKALQAGCSAFLAKPVDGGRLLSLVEDLVSDGRDQTEPGGTGSHTPPRLLLVEDDRDLSDVTSRILEKSGADVRVAETGAEAIETAKSWHPDVVLMDMNLPDMTGVEVHRVLRSQDGTRFIAMSGDGSKREECLRLGFSEFHLKPVGLGVLKSLASPGEEPST